MAIVGDFIKTRSLILVEGKQTTFSMFWEVATVLGSDLPTKMALDLATIMWATLSSRISTKCELQIFTWENQSRNEKAISFPQLAGLSGSDPHPPHQAIRFNMWGVDPGPPEKVRLNALNLAGFRENISVKGRLEKESEFGAFVTFLANQQTTSVTGTVLTPRIRHRTIVGPPASYEYFFVTQVKPNATLFTLRSRKPKLF
jgi:hypothetical protein